MSNPAKALQFGFVLSNTHYLSSVATSEAAPRGDCRFRRNRDAVARTSCQKPIGFVLQNNARRPFVDPCGKRKRGSRLSF